MFFSLPGIRSCSIGWKPLSICSPFVLGNSVFNLILNYKIFTFWHNQWIDCVSVCVCVHSIRVGLPLPILSIILLDFNISWSVVLCSIASFMEMINEGFFNIEWLVTVFMTVRKTYHLFLVDTSVSENVQMYFTFCLISWLMKEAVIADCSRCLVSIWTVFTLVYLVSVRIGIAYFSAKLLLCFYDGRIKQFSSLST